MDFEKYRNHLPYPRVDAVRRQLMGAFDDVPMTKAQRAEKEGEIESGVLATHRELVAAYRAKDSELQNLFYADAHDDLAIAYLPKPILEKLDKMAWTTGHSAGYHDVYNAMCDLAELATLAYGVGMARQEYVEQKGIY